jgi:hypothetical protein
LGTTLLLLTRNVQFGAGKLTFMLECCANCVMCITPTLPTAAFGLQMAAGSKDLRLKRMLEASAQLLQSASRHQVSLPHTTPLLSEQLVDATSTLVVRVSHAYFSQQKLDGSISCFRTCMATVQERLQVGTTSTVAQVHGMLRSWRGESQRSKVQQAGSQDDKVHQPGSHTACDPAKYEESEHSASETAALEQRDLVNIVKATGSQLVAGVQFHAERAREAMSSSIKRG